MVRLRKAPVPMPFLYPLYGLLVLAVLINISLWLVTHRIQPVWPNVPPAPTEEASKFLGLGDTQLAYRTLAYQLQLMGNEGGLTTPLYKYNYDRLGVWFMILHHLDPKSDYVPYVASYYFGATQRPEQQLKPVIRYLEVAGSVDAPGKWRWLSHAVYLAQHKYKDMKWAVDLAYKLSRLQHAEMPHWARQMPAIVSAAQGDKDAAVKFMTSVLIATVNDPLRKPDPVEVNFMVEFICSRMQTAEQARANPICQTYHSK